MNNFAADPEGLLFPAAYIMERDTIEGLLIIECQVSIKFIFYIYLKSLPESHNTISSWGHSILGPHYCRLCRPGKYIDEGRYMVCFFQENR